MKKQFTTPFLIFFSIIGVIFLVTFLQQKQEFQSHASSSSILSFSPSSTWDKPIQKNAGEPISLDLMIDPGKNYVSIMRLQIIFDPSVFKLADRNPFVINSAVLPTIVEGPVINESGGYILVTLSVGTDPKKAIKTSTKIATLNLITLNDTGNTPNAIAFGPQSEAYSVAPSDQAFEDILATARPAYVIIGESTVLSITPELSQSPTLSPPTTSPIPTATPNPQATNFSTNVCLHGIGNSGDNTNPIMTGLSNKSPQRIQRSITLTIYNTSDNLIASKTDTASYNPDSGCFLGMANIGTKLPAGNYTAKVKTDGNLRKIVPGGTFQITNQTVVALPSATLTTGDANDDNKLDILDYNLIMGCYSDFQAAPACDVSKQKTADLNDDGKINQVDYNLFVREISVQKGD